MAQKYHYRHSGIDRTWGVIGIAILVFSLGWLALRAIQGQQWQERYDNTTQTGSTAQPVTPTLSTNIETTSYVSRKGVVLRFDRPLDDTLLTNPMTITGEVPGNWSFEASFPVELLDASGAVIARQPATLQGDWMTTSYVPFTVTLNFTEPEESQAGELILRKDNPSGLTENEDEVIINVRLGVAK